MRLKKRKPSRTSFRPVNRQQWRYTPDEVACAALILERQAEIAIAILVNKTNAATFAARREAKAEGIDISKVDFFSICPESFIREIVSDWIMTNRPDTWLEACQKARIESGKPDSGDNPKTSRLMRCRAVAMRYGLSAVQVWDLMTKYYAAEYQTEDKDVHTIEEVSEIVGLPPGKIREIHDKLMDMASKIK